jgi:glycosyltransferase involved in cell wall biosynthesis
MNVLRIVHYQRRRRGAANYSLEFIFEDLRRRVSERLRIESVVAPFVSQGFFPRLIIILHAWWHQGDITHITGDITFAAILLTPRKTIVTVLDCGILHRKLGIERWLIKKIWFDWPMARCRWITTISQSAASDIAEQCNVDIKKIKVIPVAISESFRFSRKAFNGKCPRILQVGTAPNKNIARVIQALQVIPCTFVIIGRLSDELKEQLQKTGIDYENYHSLSQEEVVREYELADIVCFASTYEGFGMPILEAQATGRAVVTSDRFSMPEVAGNGALLVNPESIPSIRDGILQVIQNESLRNELIENGVKNIQRFRGDVIALQFEDIYRSMY